MSETAASETGASAHPLVWLARLAVESYVLRRDVIEPPDPLPTELAIAHGTFVCLKLNGELRGCVGTVSPLYRSVAREVIQNAIAAATRDPRFGPVLPDELPGLRYSVDLLHTPEPVEDISKLDPARYGVIVTSGRRRGLLLPHLPGIDDARLQVALASQKAGIAPDEPLSLQRFLAERLV